jgi:hypothetical protein
MDFSIRHSGIAYCTKLKKWYLRLALISVTFKINVMKILLLPIYYVAETEVLRKTTHLTEIHDRLIQTVVFHATVRLRTK